jgi:hypothetical protein
LAVFDVPNIGIPLYGKVQKKKDRWAIFPEQFDTFRREIREL